MATARHEGTVITKEELAVVLPTLLDHINVVGKLDLDLNRRLPFYKKAVGQNISQSE